MMPQNAQSFGIIPIYKHNKDFKIAIVKNSKSGQWGLPKGTPEKNEEPLETARRELEEETGIENILIHGEPIFTEEYKFVENGVEYNKINTYYLGFVDETMQGKNLDQIDEMRWVTFNEARDLISHQSTLEVLDAVEDYLRK